MIFGRAAQTVERRKILEFLRWQSIAASSDSAQGDFNRDLEHIFCFVTVNIGRAALQWNKAQLDVNTETITLSP